MLWISSSLLAIIATVAFLSAGGVDTDQGSSDCFTDKATFVACCCRSDYREKNCFANASWSRCCFHLVQECLTEHNATIVEFRVDDRVRLQGLKDAQYNGRVGLLAGYHHPTAADGKWIVKLVDGEDSIMVEEAGMVMEEATARAISPHRWLVCQKGSRGPGGECTCVNAKGWNSSWHQPYCYLGQCYSTTVDMMCAGTMWHKNLHDGTWCWGEQRHTDCSVFTTTFTTTIMASHQITTIAHFPGNTTTSTTTTYQEVHTPNNTIIFTTTTHQDDCFLDWESFVACCCTVNGVCFSEAEHHRCCHNLRGNCPKASSDGCWNYGFQAPLCCNVTIYGPRGNLNCWPDANRERGDVIAPTFDRCCNQHALLSPSDDASLRESMTITETLDFWERRYSSGGASADTTVLGALGAAELHGWLAHAIRNILTQEMPGVNRFRALDLGIGDGRQAATLMQSADVYITGLDLSWHIIYILGQQGYVNPPRLRAYWYDGFHLPQPLEGERFHVALSLSVVIHLLEDELFERYMTLLFEASAYIVIIHAPDVDDELPHVQHQRLRRFGDWISSKQPNWELSAQLNIPRHLCIHSQEKVHVYKRFDAGYVSLSFETPDGD